MLIAWGSFKKTVWVKDKLMSLFKTKTTEYYSKPMHADGMYGSTKKSKISQENQT